MQQRSPLSITCLCAPPDLPYLQQWERHLRPLEQAGYLTVWSEHHLHAGADRVQELFVHVEQAAYLVLLLSADFFDNEVCRTLMERGQERQREGSVTIIPLLVRPVAWQDTSLGKLPCLPANGVAITMWESPDEGWRQAVMGLQSLLGHAVLPSPPRNPYKGLRAFTQNDTHDFFGRDALVEALTKAIAEILSHERQDERSARLLTVLGASGSGKSSVVLAGLIPHLQDGMVLNSKEWMYLAPIVPGADPLEALLIALKPHFPDTSFKTLREDLTDDPCRGLHLLATQLVNQPGERVILVIDQFEEIFTLTTDEAIRRRFLDLLVEAVTVPCGPLFVILTLRADAYDRPMQYPELYRLIDEHHVSVLPMEQDELRSVIEGPASLPDVQLSFEPGLVEELFFAVQGQSGALPLLEFTLEQLVQRRNGHRLTLQSYREMGEVKGALSQYAEEVYQGLPSNEHRENAHALFLRLIHPGLTDQDTARRRALYTEFEQADPRQTQRMHETLDIFVRARLLTSNQTNEQRTIEVSHEALIREWRRLTEWLREAREDILFQQSLSEDVAEWEKRQRPTDRLYRGIQLKEARAWANRNPSSEQEARFLQASVYRQALVRAGLVVLALVLVFSLAGLYFVTHPDTTLVTNLQDSGNGSLRYCIENAPSRSTITFAQGLQGTIHLTTTDLVVSRNLTILGPGADRITISGGNSRLIVHIAPKTALTISDLSFKDSHTDRNAFLYNDGTLTINRVIISNNIDDTTTVSNGGGIYNGFRGVLNVSDSIISGNKALGGVEGMGGGISNDGKLTVTNSVIRDNSVSSGGQASVGQAIGGGIYNYGTVTLINSTLSGNTAISNGYSNGGGIENYGKLSVTDSTFLKNSASSSYYSFGGGIDNQSIDNQTGTITVSASTFSGNSSSGKQDGQGGGIDNEGKLTVAESTISQNTAVGSNGTSYGGGICNVPGISSVTINSSITAANKASNGPDIFGVLTSGGYNLLTNIAGVTGLNTKTDRQVTLANLKLDLVLRNNGGPTQTLALLPGSPAIDAVPENVCKPPFTGATGQTKPITTDQRGDPRPDAGENRCDIGAYESSY